MHRIHLVIHGRVQGVGFRWFAQREATALELAGAVWNRADGAVELEAEGPRSQLEQLLAIVRRGPAGARVAQVAETWSEGSARHATFLIAPTA
jgi:acylphosphatase